jgi:DNA-binding NtrC family response regulator
MIEVDSRVGECTEFTVRLPRSLLSDVNMPGIDGLQLLGEIKQRCPDLPVVMVSAYGDYQRRRRASELGAAQFLSKPVDFDLLKEQLRRLSGGPDREPPARSNDRLPSRLYRSRGPGQGRLRGMKSGSRRQG